MTDDEPAGADDIDPGALVDALAQFGGTDAERRTVARQAVDLADSGKYRRDASHPLTVDLIAAELADADEGSPVDRWNWWMGVLSLAYGGYERFAVRRFPGSGESEE